MLLNPGIIRTFFVFSAFFLLFSGNTLYAQKSHEDGKVISGKGGFSSYTVLSGDTPFSIARKFGITLEKLINANPGIENQLKLGQTIKIPDKGNINFNFLKGLFRNDHEDAQFYYHKVYKRETAFSVARDFNISRDELYKYNPKSIDGISEGDELKIPKKGAPLVNSPAIANATQETINYIVGRQETLYGIARKFNATQEDILRLNPSVSGNLTKGRILIIPMPSPGTAFAPVNTEEKSLSIDYKITNGDNYYQMEKRFGVSQSTLEQLNPELKNGFKTGMVIKIPSNKRVEAVNGKVDENHAKTEAVRVDNTMNANSRVSYTDSNKIFEVGIYLPICIDISDSVRIAQHTNSFLEFYCGVLIATEKLAESGMKVKLFVYDTNQDSATIEKLVKKPEFLSFDLIIGPVFPENQKIMSELSAKNHIPMVSPLSSDSRYVAKTPGYYQINPGRKLRLTSTADYISDKFAGQNIILLNHEAPSGDEKLLLDRLNQRLGANNLRHYNIMAEDGTTGLEALVHADKENIFVLADGNEANVSVALTRLNTISKTFKIKVVGLQEYTKMQSINTEYLHNIDLHYLSPYYIDYGNSKVNGFIGKYRAAFNSEPSQYSFQGYDVALHFIATLGKLGRKFPERALNSGVDLLQAEYNFQRLTDFGGFINRTLYIIEYTNDYEVRSTGKIEGIIGSEHGTGKATDKNSLDQ